MAHTSDVCHYLRNYPFLETANDFDKMATTMNGLFDHLSKVRTSRYYDLERAAKLLEAFTFYSSKMHDCCLAGKCFRFIVDGLCGEYESKVRYPTQDVFVQFDDRYDQFFLFGTRTQTQNGQWLNSGSSCQGVGVASCATSTCGCAA